MKFFNRFMQILDTRLIGILDNNLFRRRDIWEIVMFLGLIHMFKKIFF